MPLSLIYLTVAMLALIALLWGIPWWLSFPLLWTALAFAMVGSAYWFNRPRIFRKRADGRLSRSMRWLLLPFLAVATLYNGWRRLRDKTPRFSEIRPQLYLGSRLFIGDLAQLKQLGIGAIVDVTAEFDAIPAERLRQANIAYLNVPVLDHAVPDDVALRRALQWMDRQQQRQRTILVHCALGRGRSVLLTAAWLLHRQASSSVAAVLTELRLARNCVRLNARQLALMQRLWQSQALPSKYRLALVVNPVAGGGKWQQHRQEICQRLEEFFELSVLESAVERDGRQLARQAVKDGADILVAAGGDGTVTEVASVLVGSELPLGIIPLGTTNAFSQVLWGIGSRLDPIGTALEAIIAGEQCRIDTARCNQRLVLLLVGIGFQAQMIKSADRQQKNTLGELAYLQGFWQALSRSQVLELHIRRSRRHSMQLRTNSLVVANCAPMTTLLAQGGGRNDVMDGWLDMTWLPPDAAFGEQMLTLAELSVNGLLGKALGLKARHERLKRVRVVASEPFDYVIDGEQFSGSDLDIRIRPGSLSVLLPAQD